MKQHLPLLLQGRRAATAVATAALLAGLSACHTTPTRNLALDDARQTFQEASASTDVTTGAPVELDKARQALFKAEQAKAHNLSDDEVSHLAYLAQQQSRVAINVGMQHAADNMVTAAGVDRERLQAQAKEREAAAANERANDLEQQLNALAATKTNRGLVVVLQDVLFDVGKSDLKPGAKAKIERIATVLQAHPERRLMIEGFTDSTGGEALNQKLSEARAQAVALALIRQGISADRIDTKGFGEAQPVASNASASGRQQNRRVELVFSDGKGVFASPS
jgi:outer membrane protein OmpA-like peptidoglycan-associated protein